MTELIQDIRSIFVAYNVEYLAEGLGITLGVALATVVLSLIFGTVLGIARTYGRLTRTLASIYIEIFRNTPNLLWIFICFIFAPFPTQIMRATFAMVLFTSAVMAEIVRGGLNAVDKGQIEAGKSQGFDFFQILIYIVLPQCFRKIVPTLLSQVTTTIKDTSFLAQVAIAELMYRTKNLMSTANKFTGHSVTAADVFVLFGFAAIVYFVINFSLSLIVRRLQRRVQKA